MATADLNRERADALPPPSNRIILAVLFILLGVTAFALNVYWVLTTPALANNPDLTAQNALWNLAQSIGVVRPILLVFAGVMMFRLSYEVGQGDISAARWAVLIFTWLVVAGVFMALVRPLLVWMDPLVRDSERANLAIQAALPYAVAAIVGIGLRFLVVQQTRAFLGEEDINKRNARRAWGLLAPLLVVFLAIAVTPLERVFVTSLTDERFASSAEPEFLGMENYRELWSVRLDTVPCLTNEDGSCALNGDGTIAYPRPRNYFDREDEYNVLRYRDYASFTLFGQHWVISARDTEFLAAMITSIYYTVLAIALQFTIGFFMAMIIAQRTRGIGIMRVVMLVPMAIPTLIASQFWEVMLRSDQTGLINALLLSMGVIQEPQSWLLDPALQVPTLVAVIVWKETPITALLLLPGLLAIPKEVYQAGAIDGANRVQRFFQITMPLMRPTLGVVLVLRTMLFLRVFDLFDILVGRNRFVMATYAHDVLIQQQQLGYSSAVSVTIFVITMVFTIAYMRTLRIDEA